MANSFIENINTVANATKLATGDVVQDAQLARDTAVASAEGARVSEVNALDSEVLSRTWAIQGHNRPVDGAIGVDARFSSYHWAVEAQNTIGDPIINDSLQSSNYTWSSTKLNTEFTGKSDVGHTHTALYEAKFSKLSAFNKNFIGLSGNFGVGDNIARGDHTHTGVYEPKRATQGTAYNLNIGTTAGTLAEGSHLHTDKYMPLVSQNTAYNKPFVLNSELPLATEIPRGNHTHKGTGVSYDSTGNIVVTSTTAQGAINQLDARVGTIVVAEKCKLIAGMTDETYVVNIAAQNVPSVINAGMTVSADVKNAFYSSGVQINYASDKIPQKLIEGQLSSTVSLTVAAGDNYTVTFTKNGVQIDSKYIAEIGDTAGNFSVSLSGWISGLTQGDVLGVAITNRSNANNITILGMTTSFAGQPEGALVLSGSTVEHDEILGKDVVNQHPTTAIYDTGSNIALDVLLDGKANIMSGIENNVMAFDVNGDIADSGISVDMITNKVMKTAVPVLNNIVTMESNGDAKDSGYKIIDLAKVNGEASNTFDVAPATLDSHAVNKAQMDSFALAYTLATTFNTHEGAANPHMTTYTDVGAAASVHVHAESDVTGLTDKLATKYTKTVLPVTNNIPMYSSLNELVDSGASYNSIALTPPQELAKKDIADIVYVDGSINTVVYAGTDNKEVMNYNVGGDITTINHYLESLSITGTTTLAYDGSGNIISSTYLGA